jgi:hypothetical protein
MLMLRKAVLLKFDVDKNVTGREENSCLFSWHPFFAVTKNSVLPKLLLINILNSLIDQTILEAVEPFQKFYVYKSPKTANILNKWV